MSKSEQYIAFRGPQRVATGPLVEVALRAAELANDQDSKQVMVFSAESSNPVDLDLRGSKEEIRKRYEPRTEPEQPRGRGRPKLGVVGKEVTLLPRHWKWLANQPGGASVALRRLVEQARKQGSPEDRMRTAQSATYKFMHAVGGDLPGFEEAMRALYSGDKRRFDFELEPWPADFKKHIAQLSEAAFSGTDKT